jgi:ABC-type transport system involved in multi-copper enzyme maturation permease subunit
MAGFGFYYGYVKLAPLNYNTYDTFAYTINDTSLIFIISLVTAWFIGNDFSNRTIQHEITLGYSRFSILLIRTLPVTLSAIIIHFTFVFTTMFAVICKNGHTGDFLKSQDVFWCITVSLQLIGLQSIITMITFISAKATSAISIAVTFTIIACNVMRNFADNTVFTKTVFFFAKDNKSETLLSTSIVAVITLILSITITYLLFRKKEIK